MYSGEKIMLTTQDILNKDFKIDARGYRPQEVDKFLDIIIADYTEFSTLLKKQEKEIQVLTERNMKMKQEYQKLRSRYEALNDGESSQGSVSNVDILRRLSQLEKTVFGRNE